MENIPWDLVASIITALLAVAHSVWQGKENAKDIEGLEKRIIGQDVMIDGLLKELNDFRVEVAKEYVPIPRLVDLEKKTDEIYRLLLEAVRKTP